MSQGFIILKVWTKQAENQYLWKPKNNKKKKPKVVVE
jgi:hypothetical protein